MLSFVGIIVLVAAVLAVAVTALVVGVCLAVARFTGAKGRPRGADGSRAAVPPAVGSGEQGRHGAGPAVAGGRRPRSF